LNTSAPRVNPIEKKIGDEEKTAMKKTALLLGMALAALAPQLANAEVFDWNYSGAGVTAFGTLDANHTGNPNEYLINALIGTRNGVTITSFSPPVMSGDATSDNLLYSPAGTTGQLSLVQASGFIYGTSDGNYYNVYNGDSFSPTATAGYDYEYVVNSHLTPGIQITSNGGRFEAATPEPATIMLCGSALAALGLIRRKRIL
jgi:hypothetical protein